MACSYSNCTNHSLPKISTCAGHRAPGSPTTPTISAPTLGSIITTAKINELRNNIRNELTRWASHGAYSSMANSVIALMDASVNVNQGTIISTGTSTTPINNAMISAGSAATAVRGYNTNSPGYGVHPNYPTADKTSTPTNLFFPLGTNITVTNYQQLLNNYNLLRQDCICNSDCNCNTVCACHGNCGCHYSDMRLKQEIVYC